MKAEEIKTTGDFVSWLNAQPDEALFWLVYRLTARAAPYFWVDSAGGRRGSDDDTNAMPLFWALLTLERRALNGVSEKGMIIKIDIEASDPAQSFAEGALKINFRFEAVKHDLTARAAAVALEAAVAVGKDVSGIYEDTLYADCISLENRGISESLQLWTNDDKRALEIWAKAVQHFPIEPVGRTDETARSSGTEAADYHSFWIPWYQGLLDGQSAFPDALVRDIARIELEEWDKGEVHINNVVIPQLMQRHAVTEAVRGERIERAASGNLTRVAVTELPENIRARAVSRTLEALGDLRHIAEDGGNQLYAIFTPPAHVIERAINRAGKNSVRLFETLEDASTRISRVARDNGLLEDGEVEVVLANFERSRNELWHNDPVVREAKTAPAARFLNDLSDAEKSAIFQIGELVEEEADADLAGDMAEDREAINDPAADPIERKRSLQRAASRILQTMNIWFFEGSAKIEKVKKAANNYGWLGMLISALWVIVRGGAP